MIFKSALVILLLAVSVWFSNLFEFTSPSESPLPPAPQVSSTLSGEQQVYVEAITKGYKTSRELAEQVVTTTWVESAVHGIDPVLVLKVIAQESRFDPEVVSPSGDIGLMQINTRWKKEEIRRAGGVHKAMEVKTNLKIGIKVLAEALRQESTLDEGLRRYNGKDKPKGIYASQVLRHSASFEGFRASI